MKNIEQAGFQRYQIDLQGRSQDWLLAYMQLRFGEVDDPNLAPKDRDNLFFRADRVSSNKPMVNWYRTLRDKTLPNSTTSVFEQDLFEREGIRFTSMAYKEGNIIKYRPAVISFKDTDQRITFDPGQATFDAIAKGDPNAFNGALRDFVRLEQKFDSDKEARAAIKEMVRKNEPNFWKATKRYRMRQDIQSMIGVRTWTFFEQTRQNAREKKISVRNKIVTQALPEDSKTGNFIKCLFGIPDCRASTDPANPEGKDFSPAGTNKRTGDKTDGASENPKPVGDGSGESTLADAAGNGGADAAGTAGDVTRKIFSKLIAKAGVLSLLDSLARFDEAIQKGTFSKLVAQVKGKRAVGYFTTMGVAADQLTTGVLTSGGMKDFMTQFEHPTNNEGWTSVVNPPNDSGKASAASAKYVKAKNKAQFCSEKHQAMMRQDPEAAEDEYQYLCPKDRIGGKNNAKELEDAWKNGPGVVLHPVLDKYHAATGGVFDIFNSVTSAVTEPAVNAALTATGTKDDVENLAAYAGEKALEYGGATNNIREDTPSGQLAMTALQGSSYMAEAMARNDGAIPSTAKSAMETQKNLAAHQAEEASRGFFYRYLSTSNPKSLASTVAFAIADTGVDGLGKNIIGIFGSAFSSPWRMLTQPAHAAVPDGYAACEFSGIQCMDIPPECKSRLPLAGTPQNATNADDLGYFKPSELTWELMTNQQDWGKALYEKVDNDENKALKVYNCALFDNTTRGGIGARYGAPGENVMKSQSDAGSDTDSDTISGDAQQLAQEILDNKNIELVNFCRYCIEDLENTAKGKHAYGSVDIDINILKFLADLGNQTPIDVNSITGEGSGHTAGSNHYIGKAVDFECPGVNEKIADEVGKKYGVKSNNERCDNGTDHSHYSTDGH